MSSKKSMKPGKVNREQLIAAIRAAVETNGGGTLTFKKFLATAKMTPTDVWRNFSKWVDALKAADVEFKRYPRLVENERLLADFGRTVRKLGHVPSVTEYASLGGFHVTTLCQRFGGPWGNVAVAFRKFAMKDQQWADMLPILPEPGQERNASKRRLKAGKRGLSSERRAMTQARMEDRQISGDPLFFEGISHAPVNETGVVLLFGAMAAKLGFMVESVRANFPDCQAKRRIGPDAWLTVRIEFEYESSSFRYHQHPPEGCDMIVCWVHNWPDCPDRLKVIALSEELARLRRERMMLAF
jgi:hypothetical protein